MTHSFLLEPGRWTLHGNWLTRDALPVPIKGKILVAWKQDGCFSLVTKLSFAKNAADQSHDDIVTQTRGRMTSHERQYTFVLQHSLLGQVEGEGWVAPESIVQRYWGLGDKQRDQQRRSGFETFRQVSPHQYYFSGGEMAGHYLASTIEAELTRMR
ncbi:MAG: hypothetical protein WBA76_11735 [Phormidesmis sp.]